MISFHRLGFSLPCATFLGAAILAGGSLLSGSTLFAENKTNAVPANPDADAKSEKEMKPYTEKVHGTDAKFQMLPIPGGEFTIGSPDTEKGRKPDEGPQRKVKLHPFWMAKCETTWDEYDVWNHSLDVKRRKVNNIDPNALDKVADAVTRPTKPYTDMTFGMGHDNYPAICMTQLAAKTYCEWLSAKTGHYYRLPTEAEWEYACRAGTSTAYSFGDDAAMLGDYGWFEGNSDGQYQKVGQKKPNPWGLHDMHGNVIEWTMDQYYPDTYSKFPADKAVDSPFSPSTKLYPHVARGGSWDDAPEIHRSASRIKSDPLWKFQDPQLPKSRWYHTDALFLGFRVVRPLVEDSAEKKAEFKGTEEKLEDR
jgi:formylglycine-generating enzyme required for sulfatase activity